VDFGFFGFFGFFGAVPAFVAVCALLHPGFFSFHRSVTFRFSLSTFAHCAGVKSYSKTTVSWPE
jgi:hypothetical protein